MTQFARFDMREHLVALPERTPLAAYKGATDKPSDRLVGWVAPGTNWKRHQGLLCLPLSKARVVDSSSNFLATSPLDYAPCRDAATGRAVAS